MTATASKVQDTGISLVTSWVNPDTKQIVNFVAAGGQDMSSGFVHAAPTEHAVRMDTLRRSMGGAKQQGHYDALKKLSPAAKPGQVTAASLQQRGMQRQNALGGFGRHSALKTMNAAPAVAPKAPMPQSLPVAVGTVAARVNEPKQPQKPARDGLRLVASNDTPKPAKPKKPTLAQRLNYWGAGLAYNLG